MKHISQFIVIVLTSILTFSHAQAGPDPTQVAIVATIEGFDLNAALSGNITSADSEAQTLPRVTVKSEKSAVIRHVREFPHPTSYDREGVPIQFDVSYPGVTLEVTPWIVNEEIRFHGSLSLVDAPGFMNDRPNNDLVPAIRTTKKLFSGKTQSQGTSRFESVSPDGKKVSFSIQLSLIDAEGNPVK